MKISSAERDKETALTEKFLSLKESQKYVYPYMQITSKVTEVKHLDNQFRNSNL